MRRIGIVGGMSWVSTSYYYRLFNELAQERVPNHGSADLVIRSLNFAPLLDAAAKDDWDFVADHLLEAVSQCARAGAELVGIACGTMHRPFEIVRAKSEIPLVDFRDATAKALRKMNVCRAFLLGTNATLCDKNFVQMLGSSGTTILTPDDRLQVRFNSMIMSQLTLGNIGSASVSLLEEAIGDAKTLGCDGVVLACTELGLLKLPADPSIAIVEGAKEQVRALDCLSAKF